MTEREKQMIAAYIPSERDKTLDVGFEYYVKDCAGRIYKVHISSILPYNDETRYSVYTDGGKRITDSTDDGNFPLRHMYDNKRDCKDETHWTNNNWECLRRIQEAEQ